MESDINNRKKTFTVKIAMDGERDNFLVNLKQWTHDNGYTFVSLQEVMFESEWDVIVQGAEMIKAFYPTRSIGWMNIQRLVDRYESGERSDELKAALQEVK